MQAKPLPATRREERQRLRREVGTTLRKLLPFGPIEGHKSFFQISSQWESQKNRFAFASSAKSIFYLSAFEKFMSHRLWTDTHKQLILITVFTGRSKLDFAVRDIGIEGIKPVLLRLSLAGNLEKPLINVPPWDLMEGARLWPLTKGRGGLVVEPNKKVMSVFKALLVLFMFEKYKNVEKEG
jgi:hypothetical protein